MLLKTTALLSLIMLTLTSCNNDSTVTASSVSTSSVISTTSTSTAPNVLLIMVDDYRVAMGAMGDDKAITPNLDKLAEQGVLFTRAYANVPVCGASRASMMTSVYPHTSRFVDYLANAEREVPEATTLPEQFKNAGYYTVANGKVFHNPKDSNQKSWTESAWEPEAKGPAYYSEDSKKYVKPSDRFGNKGPWYESAEQPDEVYYDGQVKLKTVADLKRLAQQSQPFFLAAGFRRPHLPFNAPKTYFDLYQDTEFEPSSIRDLPKNAPNSLRGSNEIGIYHFKDIAYNSDEFHRASLLGYYAAVSFIDQQIGDILSTLDELKLRDNTIVVMVSDHGFNLGEHNFWGKHNMLNKALQIPMIIDAPNKRENAKSKELVSLVDIFPTLLDLANINASPGLQQQMVGQSLEAVLAGPEATTRNQVYSRFKQGDTLVGDQLIYTEYLTAEGEREAMLYNLDTDPNETVNLVAAPEYQAQVKRMSAQLQQIKQQSENYLRR